MSKPRTSKIVHIADLFCGAGGTSEGAVDAIKHLGFDPHLTAINHWNVAIATHTKNHPGARHLCTGVDDVDPFTLYKPGELSILWASPECTHHSVARGGKPINDQSRATAWCVIRWAEKLRPPIILVENVKEFESWGPVSERGKPLVSKKGHTFHAWIAALESLGYRVDWRVVCAADYGDPTTRRRLFIYAVRGKRKIVWPNPTRTQTPVEGDMFSNLKPWRTARNAVIDWAIPGRSIFKRKKPLADKTMNRIWIGLQKFGFGAFVVPQQAGGEPVKGVDVPIPTITTTSRGIGIAQPSLKEFESPSSDEATGHGPDEGFLVQLRNNQDARSVDEPAPTLTAGGGHVALVRTELAPFVIQAAHGNNVTKKSNDDDRRSQSVDRPIGAVHAGGGNWALGQPYLIPTAHEGDERCHSVDEPLKTVAGNRGDQAVIQPYIVGIDHGGGNGDQTGSVDKPLGAIVTKAKHAVAMPQLKPFLAGVGGPEGKAKPQSVDEPLNTVIATNHTGVVQADLKPFVLPHPRTKGDGARSIDDPLQTVTATSSDMSLVEPYLIEYYGKGNAQTVNEPVPTATTKSRFALCQPVLLGTDPTSNLPVIEIAGLRYLLDIHFRMLTPRELARAQGFKDAYQFTGNNSEVVKQIGNAVPRRLARALVIAAMTQDPNVTEEDEAVEKVAA